MCRVRRHKRYGGCDQGEAQPTFGYRFFVKVGGYIRRYGQYAFSHQVGHNFTNNCPD